MSVLLCLSCLQVWAGAATNTRLLKWQEPASAGASFSAQNPLEWRQHKALSIKDRAKMPQQTSAVITDTDEQLEAGMTYGTLSAPDGNIWTYTGSFTTGNGNFYTSATFKVYDGDNKLVGEFTDNFEVQEHTDAKSGNTTYTGVNYIGINPYVTQKFFETTDSYEVILFVHATTADHNGAYYSDVFSLKNGEKVFTMNGNVVYAINGANDAWSEDYILVAQEDIFVDKDKDGISDDYIVNFNVWTEASWGSEPKIAHTFSIPYSLIAGSGEEGLPLFANLCGKDMYYATSHYEKPYFVPDTPIDQDPVVNTDNNLIITLCDSKFDTISQTRIPVPEESEYIYTFPQMGGLNYTEDLTFGLFTEGTEPAYIVTFSGYTNDDDYVNSFYVYNTAGERIATIAEETLGCKLMSDVKGQPMQFCFIKKDAENYDTYHFVDLPSCQEVLSLRAELPSGNLLSTSMERYAAYDNYQYAFALVAGEWDDEDNVLACIAWYNADGTTHHTDSINLGQDAVSVQTYIAGAALNPYIFDTNNEREYMFLVKRDEQLGDVFLEIYNDKSELLLKYSADEEKGGNLANIYLLAEQENPKLLCVYSKTDSDANYTRYLTMNFTSLPLHSFAAGGKGTKDDPYQIATVGDFQLMKNYPTRYFAVINDLDFENRPWEGVKSEFKGGLNGNNHILNNLHLDNNGIFAQLSNGAIVQDLTIVNPTLSLDNSNGNMGIVANYVTSLAETKPTTIQNVHIYNPTVQLSSFTGGFGGIAGDLYLFSKVLGSSVNDAQIDLPQATYTGGIAATTGTSSSIQSCAFSGQLNGGEMVGGIVALTANGGDAVTHCHTNADLSGSETVGGIVGNSARSIIRNCHAEGTLKVINETQEEAKARVGGIVGDLDAATEAIADSVIANCLVGISAIEVPAGKKVYAHRVVGYSSNDVKELNWEAMNDWTDAEWDAFYAGEKEGIYLPATPEDKIHGNYVTSNLAVIDSNIEATEHTTEGATLAAADFTSDFLTKHLFLAGTTVDAPWVHGQNPYLWFENELQALVVDKPNASLIVGETLTLAFTVINGDASLIELTTDEQLLSIVSKEANGKQLTVVVKANAEGNATITGKIGELTASSVITCVLGSAVDNIIPSSFSICYNGLTVEADNAQISLYNINGMLVMQGYNTVATDALAKGIYIATARNQAGETAILKIAVR